MQLNVQSSFGKAKEMLRRLICRGLPERLSVPSLADVSFLSIHSCSSAVSHSGFRRSLSASKFPTINPATPAARSLQRGFTLVELLVVITLVGLLAMGIVISLDGVDDDAMERLTKAEMSELRKALLQFKRDVGHFPGASSPFPPAEDEILDLLKECQSEDVPVDGADENRLTYDAGCLRPYNIDTGRGWNGPYAMPERMGDPVISGYFDAWGRAYRMYDQGDAVPGNGLARIVSFGLDGQDGVPGSPNSGAADCGPIAGSDDIVLCLVQ